MGEANLRAMWCHPISSEPVTKGQINGIKMGDTQKLAPQTMGFVPLVMLLYLLYFRLLALCLSITSSGGQCCGNVPSVIIT